MSNKRILVFLFVLVLCVSQLVGCSSNSNSSNSSSSGTDKKVIYKLSHPQADGHPIDVAADKFAELVAERTEGRVEVQVFPANMMGAESVTRDMIKQGSIDIVLLGSAANNYNNAIYLPSAFYLMHNIEETDYMLYESDFAKKYMYDAWLKNDNVVLLDSWTQSPRQTMSKKPFRTPEELSKIKLRVPAGIPIWEQSWNKMGAMTVSLALSDAFSALQQGVCDAVEGPIEQLSFNSFQEVAKNLILTEHNYYSYQGLINADSLNKLSEGDQKVIRETMIECGDYADQLRDENVNKLIEDMKADGVTVIELTDAEKAVFAEKANEAVIDNMDQWGEEAYNEFMAEIEEFRAAHK
jgi:TRAP-type C4-dicarboxylate transport system substrate-binding protein